MVIFQQSRTRNWRGVMQIKCRVERCGKIATVNAHFTFCPYCGTRYIAKGIDVPDLVAKEATMFKYRFNRIAIIWPAIALIWAGVICVPVRFGIIDYFIVSFFFNAWLISLPVLIGVSTFILEHFFIKPKFKEVCYQPYR